MNAQYFMNFFEVVVFSEFFEKEKGAGWVTWAGPRRNGSPRAGAQWRRRAQDRAFLFLVFFSFFTKKYSTFFYKKNILIFFYRSSSLAPWPRRQGAWRPGLWRQGARHPHLGR